MEASSLRRWALAPVLVIATAALALALIATPAAGEAHVTYTVTIENLTSGQPFTPPVVITHSSDLDIFETASPPQQRFKRSPRMATTTRW